MALLDDQVVADLLEVVPAKSAKDAAGACANLLKAGVAAIGQLAGLLLDDGHGDDSKVRYAFHGLAIYAGRAEGDRRIFAEAVSLELEKAAPPSVKMFLMQQVYIAGAVEAKPALKKLEADEEVGVEAKRILSGFAAGEVKPPQ
jgi:hypothetical protein